MSNADLTNPQILALKQLFDRDSIKVDASYLTSLQATVNSFPSPIREDITDLMKTILSQNRQSPALAFGFITTLLSGASTVLKYIDTDND